MHAQIERDGADRREVLQHGRPVLERALGAVDEKHVRTVTTMIANG